MNNETSPVHASPVSQPDVPHLSAPPLDISHHVSEELVPVPTPVDTNAPPALDTTTPARIGFLSRLFGSSGLRQQEERYITDRRRAFGSEADSASPSEEQRLVQLQITAEATQQRMITPTDPRVGTRVRGLSWDLPTLQPTLRETLSSPEPLATLRGGGTPAAFPATAGTSR